MRTSLKNREESNFMILALDIGNTNIVFGCLDDKNIYFTSRLKTDTFKTEDEYAVNFKCLLELNKIDLTEITGCIISSVVPPLNNIIKTALNKITDKNVLLIDSKIKTGLKLKMDEPKKLGGDLIVDAIAAINEYPRPLVIFDMGTATTVSVIDSHDNYIGGMIFPGLKISLEALSKKTSQLPHIDIDSPDKLIGSNTIDCMKSGIINGTASMIDGLAERIECELGEKVNVIITGGLSSIVSGYCKHSVIHDNNLLLKGLLLIYKMNTD